MKFVKTEDLKLGMRLAKPIYNNKGVLLYDRNSTLTSQGIESVRNFKLIGLYILEPAEPLPPMSEEDMEFEKFQMVAVFSLKDELQSILTKGKTINIHKLSDDIFRRYARIDHKINFIQSLRSPSDFVYKHSLNVAILTALMMSKMNNMRPSDKEDAIVAALVHDVGKLKLNQEDMFTTFDDPIAADVIKSQIRSAQREGMKQLEEAFLSIPNIKRAAMQAAKRMMEYEDHLEPEKVKMVDAAKAICVAELYDTMTAMNADGETQSEVAVLKAFRNNKKYFDKEMVNALFSSVNFLAEGTCVELSNGEKALVIAPNDRDALRPMVLCFSSNTIVDLGITSMYADLEIVDIMKTLDNRHIMGDEAKAMFGNQ